MIPKVWLPFILHYWLMMTKIFACIYSTSYILSYEKYACLISTFFMWLFCFLIIYVWKMLPKFLPFSVKKKKHKMRMKLQNVLMCDHFNIHCVRVKWHHFICLLVLDLSDISAELWYRLFTSWAIYVVEH